MAMRRLGGTVVAVVAVASALLPTTGGAQEEPPAGPLAPLAFMSGCWEGSFTTGDGRQGVIEERYGPPSINVMLGTTRYLVDGRTGQFELTTIRTTDEGVVLLPYPGGRPSGSGFLLTSAEDGVATFEAPEHDFPRRIIYRRTGDGLTARIDDGTDEGRAQEWEMTRVGC